jgi:hypothetical protein
LIRWRLEFQSKSVNLDDVRTDAIDAEGSVQALEDAHLALEAEMHVDEDMAYNDEEAF